MHYLLSSKFHRSGFNTPPAAIARPKVPTFRSPILLAALAAFAAFQIEAPCLDAQTPARQSPRYDVLITGGSMIDGTGSPARVADIGIRGDRITAVSDVRIPRSQAARVIDASGKTVAPGFIDMHAHLDPLLLLPLAESALRQGVTTGLGGPDGGSPLPLAPYMDSVRALTVGINVGYLVGHNDIRRNVMGMSDNAPTSEQLARMKGLIATAMRDGAFGLSTGLLYLPGTYSTIDEVVALAQVAADSGGIYTSHLRKEGLGLLEGVGEALEIGRRARIPVVLTHHKAVGRLMWGKSVLTVAMVDSARRAGTDVLIDQYPYTATHTGIGVLVPPWAMAGGNAEFEKRLAVPAMKDSILRGITQNILTDRGGGDLARVQFARVTWDKTLEGKTLADWAARRGMAPTPENGAVLVLEAMTRGGANAIYHVLDEGDVRRIMTSPHTMIASDGRLSQPGEGHPHPRAYGTFPRVLGEYVRAQKLMPLETAIYKMTGMPAKRLGLRDRGVLREGAFADVVIFDADSVRDQATFTEPHQYPVGIETVIVNGKSAVVGGKATGVRAGRVLTRPPKSGGA
ncbi:MAG: D-aminoacylase [Gemmatimonadota bacterium]|nr:D-aminoacylase [Gemmatimonadota bacterium]